MARNKRELLQPMDSTKSRKKWAATLVVALASCGRLLNYRLPGQH